MLGDRTLKFKFISPNLVFAAVGPAADTGADDSSTAGASSITVWVLDATTGRVLVSHTHKVRRPWWCVCVCVHVGHGHQCTWCAQSLHIGCTQPPTPPTQSSPIQSYTCQYKETYAQSYTKLHTQSYTKQYTQSYKKPYKKNTHNHTHHQTPHPTRHTQGAHGPVHAVFCEHWVAYHYVRIQGHRYQVSVMELYDAVAHNTTIKDVLLGTSMLGRNESGLHSSSEYTPIEVCGWSTIWSNHYGVYNG